MSGGRIKDIANIQKLGHIEFRTKTGFVSDFTNVNPSKRPLIGVYVKP